MVDKQDFKYEGPGRPVTAIASTNKLYCWLCLLLLTKVVQSRAGFFKAF